MKVSEIPYVRYTIEEGRDAFRLFKDKYEKAASADDVLEARKIMLDMMVEYSTAASLSNCRFTLNTADEFYQGEVAYYDENSPLFSELLTEYSAMMLASPFRKELEKKINPRIFKSYEISQKAFSPVITEDSKEENALVTSYSKFMSGLTFDFNGEKMPLSKLRGFLSDSDRDVRRKAAETIGTGLGKHADTLDEIYDKLVKVRDRMAKKMGYRNFIELGYYRMGRLDYNADMVAEFRKSVCDDLVPAVTKIKQQTAAELGIDRIMFYDNDVYSSGDAPKPVQDSAGIMREALSMYEEMSPITGDFMRRMQDAEAFDVIAREGKWGGGYCTSFAKYKQPFILANFNGTSDDIDVITHEFGHALASDFMYREGDEELDVGGMETAECHSMSMEFLAWPYMDRFFGKNTAKYKKKHLLSALSFIPYGVIVDEFQHIVYAHPEYSPARRNEEYLKLEKKYRPYISFDGIPYLEDGTRWQYQMHIYESPFYYIDYCLAQTVALGFLVKSRKDHDEAFNSYIRFLRQGGQKGFGDLVREAGIAYPFEKGALSAIASSAEDILKSL